MLNYRTPEMTLRAVEAALREMQGYPGELIVVDNASGDASFETIAAAVHANGWGKDSRVRVIQAGRNGGFGAGNNVAIQAGLSTGALPDYVYILNSDAFPDQGAITALLDCLQSHPQAGLAGSFIHGPDGTPHGTAFRFPSIASEFESAACTGVISRLLVDSIVPLGTPKHTRAVDWLAGASLMLRRRMLDEIGLFDERFFLYFEETDLCRRAAARGWQTIYVRESSVTHIGSASTGMKTWARTPGYWFDSRLHYFVKTHGRAYAALATLAHISGAVLYRARCLVSSKPRRDPARFLRDLIWHALRQIRITRPGRAKRAPVQTVSYLSNQKSKG